MINTDAEYRTTRYWAERFRVDVERLEEAPLGRGDPLLRICKLEALRSEFTILGERLREYEARPDFDRALLS